MLIASTAPHHRFPLASPQKGLWLASHREGLPGLYQLSCRLRWEGRLDAVRLEQAAAGLAELHPMLTARLTEEAGVPVWDASPRPIPPPMVRSDPGEGLDAEVLRFVDTPLPLDGPLFVYGIWQGEQSTLLVLVWHHLVMDGLSAGIVAEDFLHLYDPSQATPEPRRPSEPYADFAAWTAGHPATDEGRKAGAYWKARWEGRKALHSLPVLSGGEGAPGLGERLFDLVAWTATADDLTIFVRGLGAYLAVLSLLTGREDPFVVVPMPGRPRRLFRRTVGHFTNLVPLGARFTPDLTLAELEAALRADLAEGRNFHTYPFEALVRDLDLAAPEGHQVMTDAYFGLVPLPDLRQGPLEFLGVRQGGAAWNLAFEVQSGPGGAVGLLRYPRNAWTAGDIDRLESRLKELFRRAFEEPETPVFQGIGLGEAERTELALRTRASGAAAPEEDRPLTPGEAELAALWQTVLEKPVPGPSADFFALGGHSLSAARVLAALRAKTGKDLPLSALFLHRRLADLAAHLESLPDTAPTADLPLRTTAVAAEGARRLSFSQRRMWYLNLFAPEDPAYNMGGTLLLRGPFDEAALTEAFRDLQTRHAALRTTFGQVEGEPVQKILPQPVLSPEVLSLEHLPEDQARLEAAAIVRRSTGAPYDLESKPAVRLLVLRLTAGATVLSLNLHHILSDQWSMGVLARDLFAFYQARTTGTAADLPPAEVEYVDYADHDLARAETPRSAAEAAYWKQRLAGVPRLEWPTDFPRGLPGAPQAGMLRLTLEPEFLGRVQALALGSGTTAFAVYLAAFALVIHRYSGLTDFAVGVPTANRDDPRLENVVGTFVNTLVLRITLRPDDTYDTLVRRIFQDYLEAFEARRYPFERLVEDLKPDRSSGVAPLAQVLFNLANAPVRLPEAGGITSELFVVEPAGAQFELAVNIDDQLGRTVDFTYDRRVFRPETVGWLAAAWRHILERGLVRPEAPTAHLQALTPEEQTLLETEQRGPAPEYPAEGLAQRLWAQAEKHPERPALVSEGRHFTYREAFGRASGLAEALKDRGVGPGDIVALHLDRGAALVLSILAVLARGAAYLPLDPAYPKARKSYMLTHSGAKAVVEMGPPDDGSPEAPDVARLDYRALEGRESTLAPVPVSPETPAYILYTSGSTGTPKGVVVVHRGLMNFLTSMAATPGLKENDVLLSVTSPSFDISGLEYHLPLLQGATAVLASRDDVTDPQALRALMRRWEVTVLQATPATWRMLLESGWTERLKTALCGGEAFPQDLVEPLTSRADAVWNMYGPTETTIWSTLHRVLPGELQVPVGRPIANTQVYVLDPEGRPAPPLVAGDLFIAGDGLAQGYHRSPELTAAAFVPVPWAPEKRMYRTGDRARVLAGGELEFLGRADAQVKVNGHRIELGEIEAALASYPGVRQAVCAVQEPSPGNKMLAAFLTLEAGAELPTPEVLDGHLLTKLPAYMVPSAYLQVDAIPLGASGKVDRRALPRAELRRRESLVPPADEFEATVLEAWKTVLGRDDLGMEDDFFALGGHSLLAVRLVAALWKVTGVELPLRLFFSRPTARGVCRSLHRYLEDRGEWTAGRTGTAGETELLVPFQTKGSRPPVFLVAGVFADEDGGYRYLSALVHHLGTDQPLYLLRPRGLVKDAPEIVSVAELAAAYAEQVRAVQPAGPYRIVGECVGGIYAYELARQLRQAGDRVSALVLLDTEYPLSAHNRPSWRMVLGHTAARLRWRLANFLTDKEGAFARIRDSVLRARTRRQQLAGGQDASQRILRVEERYAGLARTYQVPVYPGKVWMLANQDDLGRFPGLGWKGTAGGPHGPAALEVVALEGTHVTRLTDHGAVTGRRILEALDSV